MSRGGGGLGNAGHHAGGSGGGLFGDGMMERGDPGTELGVGRAFVNGGSGGSRDKTGLPVGEGGFGGGGCGSRFECDGCGQGGGGGGYCGGGGGLFAFGGRGLFAGGSGGGGGGGGCWLGGGSADLRSAGGDGRVLITFVG